MPIHVFMTMFAIYQVIPFTYNLGFINYSITPLFLIHCLCNVCWCLIDRLGKLPQFEAYAWIRIFFMSGLISSLLLSYFRTYNRIAMDLLHRSNSNKNFYLNFWFGRAWLSFYTSWVLYASAMDLFTCLNVAPTYGGYFAAKVVVLFLVAIVLIIVRSHQDVIFGAVFTWIMYWLSVRNSQNPDLQLYRVAIVAGTSVFFLTLIALARNISFSIQRYKGNGSFTPYTREEVAPINPQRPSDAPSYMA
ncbi:hypothetical protein DSO57_1014756 [Entomophthora muscae]|uniref:Uncharacterized protein n=1 Tax=Entomophthora muscae TaxID=34485 RepID=A0ACC2SUI1_9FUNG|nr:hypothetical protein DSO57_1014756 [Entomophthora muscae]